ncbi:DNA cytosine methyltransferase [Myroides odoratimimus]|uniref:DNA cytosine methyltransferase n=1 Tax=Myroides odoratimimus TaxID=76832 RepID=UPI001F05FF44|nr:DNA cytosine methyltransferase [Myroides odoratimimus]
MEHYIEAICPDYFYVENVREFLAWGPLDDKGKPISRLNGQDYLRWEKMIKSFGYNSQWKILNSADFGSYQSRERLFIIFSRQDLQMFWPEQTHAKDGSESDLFGYHKWKPVRDILDLQDEGNSIFERKKSLAENTLKRIYAGLQKFVANGQSVFTKTYNSGNDNSRVKSLDSVINTVITANTHGLVFVSNYKSGYPESKNHSIDKPIGTVSTVPTQSIVSLQTYNGNGGVHSVDKPSPTITTKDRVAKMDVTFIDQQYSSSKPTHIEKPCNSLTTIPKFSLVKAKQFLFNPQYSDKGRSIDRPCFTLIARMDKMPPSIISVQEGNVQIIIEENDTPAMIKIKEFMCEFGIIDIKMRMLKIPELKQIQGFPKDYILKGTQTEQKKYIGNAVDVNMSKALAYANTNGIIRSNKKQKCTA